MSKLKKLAGQTVVYGLSSIVGRFLNYLLVPLYTIELFTPEEYGVVTDIFAYVGFLFVFLTYGMETAFFRFSEKQNNPNLVFTTAFTPLVVTSSLFWGLIYVFSKPVAAFLKYPEHADYVLIMSAVVALDAILSIPFAKLRLEGKAAKFATFKFINIGINIGLNIFFLLALPRISTAYPNSILNAIYFSDFGIGYIFVANLLASASTLLLFLPSFFKIKFSFSPALLRKLLIYGLPLLFAGLAGMVNEVLDRILLKYFLTVPETLTQVGEINDYIFSQIGIYGANYKLSILITLFIQAFRYAAEPFFFSQKNDKNAKKTYADVMKYFLIFGLAIFLFIMLYLDIFKYFIGKSYWEGLKIVPILLLANLFLGAVYNLSVWYKLTDKTKFGILIAGFGALITIVLNIILIPKIGYTGSAWATFACYFGMMILSYFLGQKYYPIEYDLKNILTYFTLAIGIFSVGYFADIENVYIKLSVSTLLFFGFYIFVLYKENLFGKLKKKLRF